MFVGPLLIPNILGHEGIFDQATRSAQGQLIGIRTWLNMCQPEPGSTRTPDLLWFTNTAPFRSWIESNGSSLYYPITTRTFQGPGQSLVGMLAFWWQNARASQDSMEESLVLYFGCVPAAEATLASHTTRGQLFEDEPDVVVVLRSLISQYLVLVCKSSLTFKSCHLGTDSRIRNKLSKYLAELQTADYKRLFKLLTLLVSNINPASTSLNILCILHRVDTLRQDDMAKEFLLLRTSLERLNIHLLITGTIRGANRNFNWGADSLAKIDEDTEYQGEKPQSLRDTTL